jgi:RND superfamily putative drug exporter
LATTSSGEPFDAGSGVSQPQVRDIGGVSDVQPVDQAGDTTLLRVFWEGNTQSEASQQIVADLRALDVPGETPALVGGLSADTVDLLASIGEHLPRMGLIVVGVMLLLLFLAFGSLVLPVKVILMNAVSITASFGVVTLDLRRRSPVGTARL